MSTGTPNWAQGAAIAPSNIANSNTIQAGQGLSKAGSTISLDPAGMRQVFHIGPITFGAMGKYCPICTRDIQGEDDGCIAVFGHALGCGHCVGMALLGSLNIFADRTYPNDVFTIKREDGDARVRLFECGVGGGSITAKVIIPVIAETGGTPIPFELDLPTEASARGRATICNNCTNQINCLMKQNAPAFLIKDTLKGLEFVD
jgi:hypothetical protein